MAKRRGSRKKNVLRQRVKSLEFRKARRLLPSSPQNLPNYNPVKRLPSPIRKPVKKLLHDRREWKPERLRRLLRYGNQDEISRVTLRKLTKRGTSYRTTPRQGFINPKRQEVCRRRADRRELLFKHGKVGKGVRVTTPKRLNIYSKIRC